MPRRAIATALVTATAAAVGLLWLTEWPLGVPGEWTWERIRHAETDRADSLLGICQAVLVAAAVVLVTWLSSRLFVDGRRPAWLSRLGRIGAVLGLVVTGFLAIHLLQESVPSGHGLARSSWVLYYPGSSGYYYEARRVTSLESFRERYFRMLKDPDPHRRTLHLGTHPPGLFLAHLAVRELCRRSPGIRQSVLDWRPRSVRDAQATILEGGRPLPPVDEAALWLATLLTQLAAATTAIPIYRLVRVDHSPETAWRSASLWLLVPAVAVFLPKSDCLYPLLATTAIWLWWSAIRGGGSWRAALAGALTWSGLCLSLAFLPVLVLAGGLAMWMNRKGRFAQGRLLRWSAASVAGLALPTLACWLTFDLDLLATWKANLSNHAAFYDQPEHPRNYLAWLGLNLLEGTLAVGVPLAGLTVVGLAIRFRHQAAEIAGPAWGCLGTWGALWLSGKNMGEAARLWLFLMPWACWLAGSARNTLRARDWALLMALQALLTVAVIQRVSGFHFTGLAG